MFPISLPQGLPSLYIEWNIKVSIFLYCSFNFFINENPDEFQRTIQFYGKRYKTFGLAVDDVTSSSCEDISVVIIPTDPDFQKDNEHIEDDDIRPENNLKDVPEKIKLHCERRRTDQDDDDSLPQATIRQRLLKVKGKTTTEETVWTSDLKDIIMVSTRGYMDRLNNVMNQFARRRNQNIHQRRPGECHHAH